MSQSPSPPTPVEPDGEINLLPSMFPTKSFVHLPQKSPTSMEAAIPLVNSRRTVLIPRWSEADGWGEELV